MKALILQGSIEDKIRFVRGKKVMLDSDLATLYGVTTSHLNRAVLRNERRFPEDFMFRLTDEETGSLRCQFGISNAGRGGRRYLPRVFTEQGVAMLATVLNSEQAIQVNIAIMRVFVKLREILSTHKELARKLLELEKKYETHDSEIQAIFEAIRQLMVVEERPKRRIGFR